ncbi:glutathione S-transferase family protein [Stutzerimonas azotifigens]|uniref:Glutathione S-transferase family protein n=1 Tax=Stutzerimonas azotifigens TaxID=291995 RepID=A0ABR5Z3F0_9GAMM|nr:glutathione S-transferase family protein [Stutzerimonas azotifigens]MBA1274705.1 glutathione S-transferase family protein [Stutzerimonas azotifigens]
MNMTLYGAPLSPFVRKVRLCLLEKGLDYQLEVVMPFTPPDWYLQLNPLGRIPAFKDGDFSLADSSVICQYLDERYPDTTTLYGRNAEQRAIVRWLEKYADYELAPLTTFCIFRNRVLKPSGGRPCDEQAVDKALRESLPPHFDYLESQLGDKPFFIGDQLSMADLAIASQLVNMGHGGEQPAAQHWPRLAAFLQRMTARPSLAELLAHEARMVNKLHDMAAAQR